MARFLQGPFAPVTEELTAFHLPVTGQLPTELNGRYVRIGPNALGVDDPAAHHWMLGEGMVHGVRLRDGKAEWYRNRWVRSPMVREKLGETPPGQTQPFGSDFACNTHIIRHGGRLLAVQEDWPLPYELTEDLDTVGPLKYGGVPPGFNVSAHTKLDPITGDLHVVAYLTGVEQVQYIVVDPAGSVKHTVGVPLDGNPMMHDFALSQHHVILYDTPVVFSAQAAAAGSKVPFIWDPDRPARVGVLPRDGDHPRWFPIEPCFASHTLNAHDAGDTIVVDVVTLPAGFLVPELTAERWGALDRWTIDLTSGRVAQTRLDDRPQEFPRLNETFVSRPHRFGYTAETAALYEAYVLPGEPLPDAAFTNALIKHDLVQDRVETHHFGRNAAVGEAVFAAAGGPAEDDGYVMAYVHNPDRGAADLVILAAQDFGGGPVARVHLPGRVPLGLHGSWLPDGGTAGCG
ncbi:carotenoid oxygenase family protein [Natronosporangium hydrolyticum]|uniref:Dioxygenase n=1 Tax=Natronosporangium hydrolyticum TaxID=2811111 RepID=A0A895YJ56_9ACTN|nr:carotenoid oxygenase family protein [Natronosporangium hydrolyticum]QSB16025.1 carotenoid oxygenase family protein [Natronosporangium hydrolyticum]